MSLTPLQRQQARSMGMNVDWAEDLLSFIGIRPDLAAFPMEFYTPEGANLSNANFVETFDATVAAAQSAGGGIVQIPAGIWELGSSELVVVSAGRNVPVYVEGAGINQTFLTVDAGYTGTVLHLTGLPGDGAADLYYYGGVGNLTIYATTQDVSITGTGLKVSACINTQFLNLDIRNFLGGNGFQTTFTAPDYTNQYIQIWNVTAAACDVNFRLTSLVNSFAYGIYSNDGQTRDFLCDDVKAAFFGGNFQTSAPVALELAGVGGCVLSLHNFYYEGSAGTLIKCSFPSVSNNTLAVYDIQVTSAVGIFLDADASNNVATYYGNGLTNATTIFKGRNGPNVNMLGGGDPLTLPAKFDLDAASARNFTGLGFGAGYAARYDFGVANPAPTNGPTLYIDSGTGALTFRGAGGTVTTLAPT